MQVNVSSTWRRNPGGKSSRSRYYRDYGDGKSRHDAGVAPDVMNAIHGFSPRSIVRFRLDALPGTTWGSPWLPRTASEFLCTWTENPGGPLIPNRPTLLRRAR